MTISIDYKCPTCNEQLLKDNIKNIYVCKNYKCRVYFKYEISEQLLNFNFDISLESATDLKFKAKTIDEAIEKVQKLIKLKGFL